MTKPITNLLMGIMLLFAAVSQAQTPTFSLLPATFTKNVGDTVNVAVRVANFTDIGLMQYGIRWRNTVLKLDTVIFPTPLALTNANLDGSAVIWKNVNVGGNGFVNTVWTDNSFAGASLPNGTLLYTLRFKVLTTSADTIRFSKLSNAGSNNGFIEVASATTGDNLGMVQNNSIKSGTTPPPPPPVGWALLTDPASGAQGDVITIPVKVQEFTKMTSMQYYMHWDKTKLEFQGVQDITLTDLSFGQFIPSPISSPANITTAQNAGKLGLSWQDLSPALTGVTVAPNGTSIYKLKFKILGASGTTAQVTFGPNPPNFPAEAANQTMEVPFQSVPCTVTVITPPPPANAVTFYTDAVTVAPNGNVCMDFKVKNFTNVVSAQFYVKFDKTLLDYTSGTSFITGADALQVSQPATSNPTGTVSVNFIANDLLVGLSKPNDTKVFTLCFTAKPAAVPPMNIPITMGPDGNNPVEVTIASGQSGQEVTPILTNGSITITDNVPVPCSVTVDSTKNIGCKGQSNGKIFITALGGASTWSYQWTGPSGYSSNGIADISGLKAGTYNLTATNGTCAPITKTVTLTEPDAITIPSQTVSNVKCFGGSDGSISIVPAGGTAPLTYKWSGPMAFTATSQNIANLKAGTYQVTITDANGCTAANPIQVAQAPALAFNSGAINVTHVKCFGGSDGSILLNNSVTGGTQPYAYNWTGPSPYTAASKDIGGLKTGQYTCTVTDVNSCPILVIGPILVNQPSSDLTIAIASIKDATCFGVSDGEACITISGGTPPYSTTWNGQGQTGLCLTTRPAGNYVVTVADANGCIKTLNVTIGGATSAIAQTGISVNQVSCFGGNDGSACITVSGGNSPYSYNWQPGGSTTGCANNLPAKTYAVTVTDSKGCTLITSGVQVAEPAALVLSTTTNLATGCIDLTVSGGTAPYQYLWSSNANNSTAQDPCGLAVPGTYTVTVTDSKNCTKTTTTTLVSNMSITVQPGDAACSGQINGSCIITINGGTPIYTIKWASGAASGTVTSSSSPYELGGLAGGSIVSVTVTDSQGATATGQCQIFSNPTISANISVTNANFPLFSDGAMLLEVTSGTPAYVFQWSRDGQSVSGPFITSGADTTKITGQDKGTYCVTVTDAAGCSKDFCKNIIRIFPPLNIVQLPIVTQPKCADGTDGAINITVTGGDANYTFKWTMPNGSTVTTEDLTGLKEGNYTIEVKDGSGQTKTETVVVTALSHIAATAQVVSSCGNYSICTKSICNGVGVAATTGALLPVTYVWSNGEVNQTANELCAGTNCVTVTDAAGCAAIECITVTAPEVIEVNMPAPIANTCYGICNGSAQVNPIGGVPPYSFKWSNGELGQIATKLCSGANSVTVTDNFGISTVDSFEMDGPDSLYIEFTQIAPSDYETCDGVISADVFGAQLPIQYFAWSKPNQFDAVVEDACAGECLFLSVKDARGCIVSDTTCTKFPDNGCLVGSKVMTPVSPDGKNDVLFIACADLYNNVTLEVYNRWGQLVFNSKGYNNDWDGTYKGQAGKYLSEGVYFWVLAFDGTTGRVQRKDYVTILRGNE